MTPPRDWSRVPRAALERVAEAAEQVAEEVTRTDNGTDFEPPRCTDCHRSGGYHLSCCNWVALDAALDAARGEEEK
jgi:hypothetical protein